MAGNPGDLRLTDWLGVKNAGRHRDRRHRLRHLRTARRRHHRRSAPRTGGHRHRLLLPEFWLGGRIKGRQKIILKMIPAAHFCLTISVRAGLASTPHLPRSSRSCRGRCRGRVPASACRVRVGKTAAGRASGHVPRTNVQLCPTSIGAIIQASSWVSRSPSAPGPVRAAPHRAAPAAEEMRPGAHQDVFPLVGCIFPSLFIVILARRFISIVKMRWERRPSVSRPALVARNTTRGTVVAARVEDGASFWASSWPDGAPFADCRRRALLSGETASTCCS